MVGVSATRTGSVAKGKSATTAKTAYSPAVKFVRMYSPAPIPKTAPKAITGPAITRSRARLTAIAPMKMPIVSDWADCPRKVVFKREDNVYTTLIRLSSSLKRIVNG